MYASRRLPNSRYVVAALIMLLAMSLFASCIWADDPKLKVEWQQFLPGIKGNSVIQTSDGGYLALGVNASVQQNPFGESIFVNQQPILVKTDSLGNVVWTKTYQAENGRLMLSRVIQTSDGGYALGGVRVVDDVYLNAENKISLIKIDSQGNVQWSKLYTGYNDTHSDAAGPSSIKGLIQTSDQGYVMVAGYHHTLYINEIWFVKTDAAGNLVLNKTISGGLISMVPASDAGFAIISQVMGRGGGAKFRLIKTDLEGNMQWSNAYIHQDSISSYAACGVSARDGGYILGGSAIIERNYGWLVKTDSYGNALWNKTCSYKGYSSSIHSIVQTEDGGYAFVGEAVNQTVFGEFDGGTRVFTWIVKTDNMGNIQGEAAIDMGNYFTSPDSIIEAKDGGYVFVGTWNEAHPATSDQSFWLVKIAPLSSTLPTPGQELLEQVGAMLVAAVAVIVVAGLIVYFRKRHAHKCALQDNRAATHTSFFN
jgi:hypothetical protein